MKTNRLIAALALALSSGPVFATGPAHQVGGHEPADSQAEGESASGHPMGMMSMQADMQKLRQQMMEIKRTQDPDKREALIERHMQSMQEMMRSMQKAPEGAGQGGSMEMMNQRQDMMEQRMQMMQMMMEQMMQNQAAAEDTARVRRNHDHRKQMK